MSAADSPAPVRRATVRPATVRRATGDDAPGLVALLRSLERCDWLRAEEPAAAEARVRAGLLAADGACRSVYVAAADDGAILGYVAVHWLPYFILPGPEGFVSELFLSPAARVVADHMMIDAATRESLEITLSQAGVRKGSLLDAVDRTVTGAGARLLAPGAAQQPAARVLPARLLRQAGLGRAGRHGQLRAGS